MTMTTAGATTMTTETATMTEPRPRGWSVRTRVLLGLVALMTLAFVITGGTLYAAQRTATNDRIDRTLGIAVERFSTLATPGGTTPSGSATAPSGSGPSSGPSSAPASGAAPAAPATALSGERLLYTAMQQTLPAENEGMIAMVDGRTRWTAPEQVSVRLERDPEFVAWAAGPGPGQTAMLHTVTTSTTTYRVASMPVVTHDGAGSARLIYAFDYSVERRLVDSSFGMYALVGVLALALTGVTGWFVVGRLLRPVRLLQETTRRISQTDLSERIAVMGRDDLAELTVTVNDMLDRVEGAVLSQKQLLDDAGHELRTPITVVQGHLELMDVEDPEDVRAARTVAVDELERMTFLVNDLVMLAQSGATGFVRTAPTDVGELLDEVFAKAQTLGERQWSLGSRPTAVEPLDARRITQALLQLAANAVKYSRPGSAISLGGTVGHGEVRLWVRDEGAGIRAQDQARIFERFGRVAGVNRADGAGLGLSIVDAIAQAHGGRVELSSQHGVGSTFTLVLPAEPEDPLALDPDPDDHDADDRATQEHP